MKVKGIKFIEIFGAEAGKIGIKNTAFYEVSKLSEGTFALIEKHEDFEPKVLKMLEEKPLSDRVEGKFEENLGERELEALKSLVKEGKVIKFRLNETYKKPVYKIAEEKQVSRKKESNSTFKGFIVLNSEGEARIFSEQYEEELKQHEIIGIKSFDGNYYFVEKPLFKETSDKINDVLNGKTMNLEELGKALSLDTDLIKGTCEFLKEEGMIIEKKKNLFALV